MAEPATSTVAVSGVSLVTLATALLGPTIGPLLGPYVVIILCSAVGAQWALLASPSMSRINAAMLMLRVIGTAVVLTAMIAQVVGSYFQLAVTESYGGVSFLIGALGHKWGELIEAAKQRLIALISSAGGKA